MINNKKLEIVFFLSLSNLILTNYWLKLGLFSDEIRYYFYEKPILEILLGLALLVIIFLIIFSISIHLIKKKLFFIDKSFKFLLFILVLDIFRRVSNLLPLEILYQRKIWLLLSAFVTFFLFIKFINQINKLIFFFFYNILTFYYSSFVEYFKFRFFIRLE